METSVSMLGPFIAGEPTEADWRRLDELYATKNKP
jgi:hypothetical protein